MSRQATVRCLLLLTLLVGAAGSTTATLGTSANSGSVSPADDGLVATDRPKLVDGNPITTRVEPVVERRVYRNPSNKPGTLAVTLAYDLPSSVHSITVNIPEGVQNRTTLAATTGFVRKEPGRFVSSGSDSPELVFRVNVSKSRFGPSVGTLSGSTAIDRGSWALVSVGGPLPTNVTTRSGAPVQRQAAIDGEGIVKHGLAFLGPYRTYNRTVAERQYMLVVPRTAPLVSAPEMVLDAIANSSQDFDVGKHNREAVFFAVPIEGVGTTALGTGGASGGIGRVWVRADASIAGSPAGVWTHEYVHTRQAYTPTETLYWTIEGGATYYGTLLPLQQGRVSYAQFRASLSEQGYGSAMLANPNSWQTVRFQYEKGSHVLAALDVRIRRATDGSVTLEDVFRRMNQYEGTVSYGEFRSIVADVASPAVAQWLDPYVLGSKSPPPLPNNPFRYVGAPDRDPDHDTLANRIERKEGTHPFRADTDSDGLADANEVMGPTNATLADTDNDSLNDAIESEVLTSDPTVPDTDGDGVGDGAERDLRTDPRKSDTDGDGLDDSREVELGSDPHWPDTDRDGITDASEVSLGTDPTTVDTDGDGLIDPQERTLGTDPTAADSDNDGYADSIEYRLGTDPTVTTGTVTYWLQYLGSLL